MKVSFYPGCSLKGTAKDYAKSVLGCCEALGIELAELDDWNCCGATAAHSINEKAAIGLAARNLRIAAKEGLEMVVPCPLCYNRLKTAQRRLKEDPGQGGREQTGLMVWDLANFMASEPVLDRIKSSLKRPLSGLAAVCYYGCMASRPPKITGELLYENPVSMERILSAIGVEVRDWSYKTDCCGASHLVARPDIVFTLVGNLYSQAKRAGARVIVVSCQMCQANLDLHQEEILGAPDPGEMIPVLYFTELVGLAIGHRDAEKWLKGHFVDPFPAIQEALRAPEEGKEKLRETRRGPSDGS